MFWLCRATALQSASSNGHTETALALVKAGADLHGKTNDGYGFSTLHPRVGWVSDSVGADGPSTSSVAARVRVLAVQVDGAALCVGERPHRDGDGAGQGGRGLALQGHQRVRFLEAASSCRWGVAVRGGRSVQSGAELQECLLWLCRRTALHDALLNGHTETAMALVKAGADVHGKENNGYGCSRLHSHVVRVSQCGGGRSIHSLGVELQEWPFGLCRRTALHFASQSADTETAMALVTAGADVHCKAKDGYGSTGCILLPLNRRSAA